MMKVFIAIILTFLVGLTSVLAQDYTISNGRKDKVIRSSDLMEILVGKTNEKKVCCSYSKIRGKITNVSSDSLSVEVHNYSSNHVFSNENQGLPQTIKEASTISKEDIIYLEILKNRKSNKRLENLFTVGGLLVFVGISTSINSIFVSGNRLLFVGASEILGGMLVGTIFYRRKYYFQLKNSTWSFR